MDFLKSITSIKLGDLLQAADFIIRQVAMRWNAKVAVAVLIAIIGYYRAKWVLRHLLRMRYRFPLATFKGHVEIVKAVIPAHDGTRLATTVFYHVGEKNPTILVRTPYRKDIFGLSSGRFADQGYNVLIQDCRGRFESEGTFEYMKNEDDDAVATLEWMSKQPWFDGNVGMFGISYLGCVQWAAIGGVEQAKQKGISVPRPKAFVNIMSSSDVHRMCYSDNSFNLDLSMRYVAITNDIFGAIQSTVKERSVNVLALAPRMIKFWSNIDNRVYAAGLESDMKSVHRTMGIPQEPSFDPDPKGDFWSARTYSHVVETAPRTLLVGGWYDMFIRETLRDWEAVQRNGLANRLIVGHWSHFQSVVLDNIAYMMGEALEFFGEELRGVPSTRVIPPVRLFIMGPQHDKGEWRAFDSFPPREAVHEPFYLHGHGVLDRFKSTAATSTDFLETPVPPVLLPLTEREARAVLAAKTLMPHVSQYVYDPTEPTPNLGGNVFHRSVVGPLDNAGLEAREDVLAFTTGVLTEDVIVAGWVKLQVYARSSVGESYDIFGRLCDVDEEGVCKNVCDGLQRLDPIHNGDVELSDESPWACHTPGVHRVEVDLWATAKRFAAGHRIRLLVSSGAHPKWIRNYGSAKPMSPSHSVFDMLPATIQIFHDKDHPSALYLPLLPA